MAAKWFNSLDTNSMSGTSIIHRKFYEDFIYFLNLQKWMGLFQNTRILAGNIEKIKVTLTLLFFLHFRDGLILILKLNKPTIMYWELALIRLSRLLEIILHFYLKPHHCIYERYLKVIIIVFLFCDFSKYYLSILIRLRSFFLLSRFFFTLLQM